MTDVHRLEIAFVSPLQICEIEPPPQILALLTITHKLFTITAKGEVMYTLPVDHLVNMKVSYVDAGGNPATVDGEVSWATSDAAVVRLDIDNMDSTICRVVPTGIGQAQVTATADADLGQGVRELITTCDIGVVAGEAVAGTIEPVGEAEPIAPHAEPRGA